MNVKQQKPIKPKIFTTTNITDKRQSTHKRNIKAKQNNNLNSLSSFKETNPNKVSQDLTPNNSTPSNTQASPIQIKDDTNTQTEASINTFINLLSPNSQQKILCEPKNTLRLKKNKTIVTNFTNKNYINNGIISNPYISPSIKTKINNLIIESSSTVPKFSSSFGYQSISKIDDIIHSSKTKYKKNEILDMLKTPLKFSKIDTKYSSINNSGSFSSRNRVEEMQKMLYKFFDKNKMNKVNQNINTQNHVLNSYRSCKNINQIKKEEENFEVDMFKNEFNHNSNFDTIKRKRSLNDLTPNNQILFYHKKRNSCL